MKQIKIDLQLFQKNFLHADEHRKIRIQEEKAKRITYNSVQILLWPIETRQKNFFDETQKTDLFPNLILSNEISQTNFINPLRLLIYKNRFCLVTLLVSNISIHVLEIFSVQWRLVGCDAS